MSTLQQLALCRVAAQAYAEPDAWRDMLILRNYDEPLPSILGLSARRLLCKSDLESVDIWWNGAVVLFWSRLCLVYYLDTGRRRFYAPPPGTLYDDWHLNNAYLVLSIDSGRQLHVIPHGGDPHHDYMLTPRAIATRLQLGATYLIARIPGDEQVWRLADGREMPTIRGRVYYEHDGLWYREGNQLYIPGHPAITINQPVVHGHADPILEQGDALVFYTNNTLVVWTRHSVHYTQGLVTHVSCGLLHMSDGRFISLISGCVFPAGSTIRESRQTNGLLYDDRFYGATNRGPFCEDPKINPYYWTVDGAAYDWAGNQLVTHDTWSEKKCREMVVRDGQVTVLRDPTSWCALPLWRQLQLITRPATASRGRRRCCVMM